MEKNGHNSEKDDNIISQESDKENVEIWKCMCTIDRKTIITDW